jgi:hypothetical protein
MHYAHIMPHGMHRHRGLCMAMHGVDNQNACYKYALKVAINCRAATYMMMIVDHDSC